MELSQIIANLREACRELERGFGEEFLGLLLFGSFARGEAGTRSDVDVAVIFRTLGGMEARARAYSAIRRHIKRDVTLVDLRRGISRITPLVINIMWDGVIICDMEGDLARLKALVVEIVEREGLVRYRTKDGKYGWARSDGRPLVKKPCLTR